MNKKIAAIVLALSLGGCANVDMSREEMLGVGPEPRGEPGKARRPQSSRLDQSRPAHRNPQEPGLEVEKPVVVGRPTVHA